MRGKKEPAANHRQAAVFDKGTQDSAARVFEVQPESRGMKSGTRWDEVREANAFTAPDKPRFEPLTHHCLVSTVLCSFLAARGHCSTLPRCRSRSDGTEKTEAAGASDSRETKDKHNHSLHNMQGVLKRLTPCQKEVARLGQWNKVGLTGVRESGCSRQNHASPT